jgi:hypothetical protein
MGDDSKRYDRAVAQLSRRRALAGGAALLTAGGTLVWVGSDTARADVTLDELTIPDADFESEGIDPVVDVTAKYDFDVGQAAVDKLRLTLTVGGDTVATEELVTEHTVLTGEADLSGRITDSEAWSDTDFAPAVAEEVSRTLTVGLTFEVVGTDGESIVEDSVTEDVTVRVSHPQESQYVASVGGTGTVRTATTE